MVVLCFNLGIVKGIVPVASKHKSQILKHNYINNRELSNERATYTHYVHQLCTVLTHNCD
jgi:hypothetical protein